MHQHMDTFQKTIRIPRNFVNASQNYNFFLDIGGRQLGTNQLLNSKNVPNSMNPRFDNYVYVKIFPLCKYN